MQRQRGELVSIGDALSGMGGPVKAIREASPQSRHHFTRFDQVNQLVTASEAAPDLGFMARLLALCSLPRTNPGNRHQYKRVNGPYKLILIAGGDNRLPYGNFPRLILAWICYRSCTKTQSRELGSGPLVSSEFMRSARNATATAVGLVGIANQAPQPDEPALWLHRFTDLRG